MTTIPAIPATTRLLIADDDDVLCIAVSALLRRRGIEVDIARSLSEIEMPGNYDLVILDPLLAPQEEIQAFVQRAQASNSAIEILAISEYLDQQEDPRLAGMTLLPKPASIGAWAQVVEEKLGDKRGLR